MKLEDVFVFEDCMAIRSTAKALYVVIEGEQIWVPRSVIVVDDANNEIESIGDEGMIVLPRWFAVAEGLRAWKDEE